MAADKPTRDPQPDDGSSTETVGQTPTSPRLPERIGRYHIKRIIATGGMGTVYEATQESPRRAVALKVMKRGVTSKVAQRRFEYESQVLSRLRHPNIAQVYEAGVHDDVSGPLPYFAMEYVPNAKPITEYAQHRLLGVRQKLELFIRVCQAVHHGHQKGVIHRDLKPANILVDAQGQVKIIDFGVARSTDSDMAATTQQTAVGELIGTLRYMSPEQCEADPHDIDTRSDVYALGIVLYELLSGRMPYDLEHTPIFEVPRVIREVAATHLGTIDKTLRGDVETIVEKALEKDRQRRYQSALALADEIARYLRNEPIVARAPSVTYLAGKFMRKHPIGLIAAAAVGVSLWFAVYTRVTAREASFTARLQTYRVLFEVKEASLKDTQRVIADCGRLIEDDARFAPAYAIRAHVLSQVGKYDAAWPDCNRALELDPNNALGQRVKGYLLLQRGDFAGAVAAYDAGIRSLSRDIDYPRDFHNRARAYQVLGHLELAMADHERAVALAPTTAIVYRGRGVTRRMAGDAEGAIEDFARAAQLDPEWFLQAQQWIWEIRMLRDGPGDREAAAQALAAARARAANPFEVAMVGVSLGEVPPDRALAEAKTDRLRCVAHYYIGSRLLVERLHEAAKSHFEQCLAGGANDLPETDLARWHLRRRGNP